MNRHIILLLTAFTLSTFADAASEDISPPTAPFYKTPPAGSQWSADISIPGVSQGSQPTPPPDQPHKAPAGPVRLQAWIGTNKVEKRTLSYLDRKEETVFIVGDHLLQPCSNVDKIALLTPGTTLYTEKVFPGVQGLSGKTYMGVELVEKEPCYKFKVVTVNFDHSRSTVTTWIRVADGYPRRMQTDEELLDFSAVTTFPDAISLSSEYQAVLHQLSVEQHALEIMGKRNGL